MRIRQMIVFGAGGHAVSVAESVLSAGYEISAFLSRDSTMTALLDRPVLSHVPEAYIEGDGEFVIAVGDNATRERLWDELSVRVGSHRFPTVIHPSASVSSLSNIGQACVILQGALVGAAAQVGRGCILNTGSSLDHDSVMGDFSSLAPRATTGGQVRIGRRTAISIGATINNGVSIGDDTVVGAASYVHKDLGARLVAYGIPARHVRTRMPTDPYLG